MKIVVECYAGYRADEEPRRFFIGERLIQVVSVTDRWTTPDYRYFRVAGDDGRIHALRQIIDRREWELA
ncbi:MAG: hypothetical protein ACREQW_17510 [Candidatus Binatia bacterium]